MKKSLLIFILLLLTIVGCNNNSRNVDSNSNQKIQVEIDQNKEFYSIDESQFKQLIKTKYDAISEFSLSNEIGAHSILVTLTINNKEIPVKVNYKIIAKKVVIDAEKQPYLYQKPDGTIGYKSLKYKVINQIKNPNDQFVLINKEFSLPQDFEPNDLVEIKREYTFYDNVVKIKKEAYDAFLAMRKDMAKEGLALKATSCYRSISRQKSIYNSYLNIDPKEEVDTYSARPGHSEHHTGYACDFSTNTANLRDFDHTKEAAWLKDNAYKYGFILRYYGDNSEITGYMNESWHYRYFGKEMAKKIFVSGLVYEEFYFNNIERN